MNSSESEQSTTPIEHPSFDEKKVSVREDWKDVELDQKFLVAFSLGDRRNPINFGKPRKWVITTVASFFTTLVSSAATSFSNGTPSMVRDLNCTTLQATLGLSLYIFGFGVLPLVTSAFSEEFGRQPLYYASLMGLILAHLMVALAKNIQVVLLARFLQGAFGSTGATMVAGTVADIWSPEERGLPMSVYSLMAFAGNGFGALVGGWTETNPKLEWRWIQWIHLMILFPGMIPVMKETRASVTLAKLASKLRKETGDQRYQPLLPESERNHNLRQMIYISCTRPIYLLFSEPIVFAVSMWLGFAWGVYYCMIESIPPVFKSLHQFNQGEVGSVYMTMALGGLLGFLTNFYQEKLYQRNVEKRGPQARLYLVCGAAFLFPISMFMFAWTSLPSLPWALLIVALIIFVWAVFVMYLAIFTYLADCYGPYASSALAGQSLFRCLTATVFPLFADQMFKGLGYRWANSLFGFIALAMSPVPIVLFFYGPRILARSRTFQSIQSPHESLSAPSNFPSHRE
ncbi:hypothetical protein M413DRAFT_442721 [Hebeloma cylindrosporum]|uniref:Major facilitator superfamily (MFS) profile domain-containing protein n=1 Tax=Hebeloma cylindrosporum TaxID=76867 RepID=A0A0C2Y4I2_HEBCY|nr:hypothetical protein M413DRAFT_442721 [Hebeloma cylindrosporum h7]